MPETRNKKEKTKVSVITDPIRDAEAKYGQPFLEQRRIDHWNRQVARCTTAQFAQLDGGYVRHCGPTAITNVIISFNRRYHLLRDPKSDPTIERRGAVYYFPAPQIIFQTVTGIGKRYRFYWNVDILKRFGGTYDMFMRKYLERCFSHYGFICRIYGKYPTADCDFVDALRRGGILYLQLMKHPLYGNHHVVCSGCVEIASADSRIHKLYLIISDGWSNRPRYLDTDELVMCHFWELDDPKQTRTSDSK